MSVVWASAKARAAVLRMSRLRMGLGRAEGERWGISGPGGPPTIANRTRESGCPPALCRTAYGVVVPVPAEVPASGVAGGGPASGAAARVEVAPAAPGGAAAARGVAAPVPGVVPAAP